MAYYTLNEVFGYQDANEIKKLWASETEPTTPAEGEIWLDTSVEPHRLKRRNDSGGWDIIAGGITVDNATGNVGIGTTTPDSPLVISNTGSDAKAVFIRTDGATAQLMAGPSYAWFGSASTHQARIGTSGSVKLTVDTNGYVGVGTISPTEKLHVTGNVYVTGQITSDAWIIGQIVIPTSEPASLVNGSIWIA